MQIILMSYQNRSGKLPINLGLILSFEANNFIGLAPKQMTNSFAVKRQLLKCCISVWDVKERENVLSLISN